MPDPPTFAVVIPTYDRPVALRRCLDSLAAQRYPRGRFEVIIVDDGSPEFPADVLAAYDPQLRLTLHRQVHAGPAAARNTGAAAARSRFIAFLDDDCRAHPDWLQEFEVAFRARPSRHLLGGQIGSNFPNNLPNWVSELMLQVIVEHYEPRPGGIYFLRTANLAVRLDEFRAAGGFDARFQTAEDREFSDRWLHQGGSMAYVPNARVTHDKHLSLGGFARLYFRYGEGAFRFHQLRARRGSGRFQPAFLRYYALVLRAALADRTHSALAKVPLLVLWQLCNAAGFLRQLVHDQFRGREGNGRA